MQRGLDNPLMDNASEEGEKHKSLSLLLLQLQKINYIRRNVINDNELRRKINDNEQNRLLQPVLSKYDVYIVVENMILRV